jgi:pyridoxamine 5'-phosphate oxidase
VSGNPIEYGKLELDEATVSKNPFAQFQKWFVDAQNSGEEEPTAMTLATVGSDGTPSARMVLMKGYSEEGFTFFTNYLSRKGRELAETPKASLLFFWQKLERQVRIAGMVKKVLREESNAYFQSRPLGSRLSALASIQSDVIPNRAVIEEKVKQLQEEYSNGDVPLPPYWGGYLLVPVSFEFWQGRENRLHDRLLFTKQKDGEWKIERLSP